jgi:hypothetical protein
VVSEFIVISKKNWIAAATHRIYIEWLTVSYPLYKIYYLSTPANEATEEALLLSTKPGPDGIFAPGRSPAPLL